MEIGNLIMVGGSFGGIVIILIGCVWPVKGAR